MNSPSKVPRFLFRTASSIFDPRIFPFLATAIYLLIALLATAGSAGSLQGQKDFTEGDSKAYIKHAEEFAGGDFSLDHVEDKPHRQPLYSLLIAPAMKAGGGDLFWLAVPNVLFAAMTFLLIYWGVLRLLCSPIAATVTGVLFLVNPFVFSEVTRHLLTEPLHFLLMMAVIFSLFIYLREKRPAWLLLASALTGLEYLARVNGLFVMASMVGAVVLGECLEWVFAPDKKVSLPTIVRRGILLAGAVVVFLVVSTPSWLPRLKHFGDPFHHGYLSNYMWVDTYEEGHTGENYAEYTWQDYAASHDMGDVINRAASGIWEVGFDIPTKVERPPLLFILSLAGAALALWKGPLPLRVIFIFGAVQLLPLMWTHMSNPTTRVPYAASMPFQIFFTAILVAYAVVQPWGEWWKNRATFGRRLRASVPGGGRHAP